MKFRNLIFTSIVLFLINSCTKDFVAKDITKQTINVLAPAEGLSTPNNSITFWWDEVDGTEKYNIQIVTTSFNNILQLITDTMVKANKLTYNLLPGVYQWRIKAMNNAGSTAWFTRSLTIDTTSNLTNLTLALTSPLDSLYTNVLARTFQWSVLNPATFYNFQILNSSGGSVTSQNVTTNSVSYTFVADGTYTWKVRAENTFSVSQYVSRTIIIDQTPPSTPVLTLPANNAIINLNDSLEWTRLSGALYDSIYIASDTNFNSSSVLLIKEKISGITLYSILGSNGFSIAQNYYWKVKSADKAGNISAFTLRRKFTLN